MTLIHNTLNARNAMADGVDDLVSFGAGLPALRIMAGTQAAPGAEVISLPLNQPAFGNASNGTIALNVAGVVGVVTTPGTAGHFRAEDGIGNLIFTGTIGLVGSGADLEFNTLSFANGANVNISAFSYTTST
jgi:hypothetical protein